MGGGCPTYSRHTGTLCGQKLLFMPKSWAELRGPESCDSHLAPLGAVLPQEVMELHAGCPLAGAPAQALRGHLLDPAVGVQQVLRAAEDTGRLRTGTGDTWLWWGRTRSLGSVPKGRSQTWGAGDGRAGGLTLP